MVEAGRVGQFDVIADGEKVAERKANFLTRQFGLGYPDFERVIEALESRRG